MFSDSTVLSSFAVMGSGRAEFFLDCVDYLNREALRLAEWFLVGEWLTGLVLALGLGIAVWIRGSPSLAIPCAVFVAVGSFIGTAWNHETYSAPEPIRSPPNVQVKLEPGDAWLPPVLGSIGTLDPDWCYDTFYTSISRAGFFPRLIRPDELATEEPLVWINPAHCPEGEPLTRLVSSIEVGKRVLITLRDDHVHEAAVNRLLGALGMHLRKEVHVHGTRGVGHANIPGQWTVDGAKRSQGGAENQVRCHTREVGRGSVTVLLGSEWLSRERLGHSFAFPGEEDRANLNALLAAIRAIVATEVERRTFRILEGEPRHAGT